MESIQETNDISYNTITWLTPFCLKKDNQNLSTIELRDLIYFIQQRLSTINAIKPRSISQEALQGISIQENQLIRAKTKRRFFQIGYTTYNKIPTSLISILQAGSLLHVGKDTRQGYGSYCLQRL